MKKFLLFAVMILILAAALVALGNVRKKSMYQQGAPAQSGSYAPSENSVSSEDMSDFDSSLEQASADDSTDDSDLSL